ncbi:MAG: ABC transporter permease subunit [Thermoguttaceae bacterium]|nr:ABC transporter permease subunit [Thermoguttaceae bacterium]MDW8037072.1 ABC transporter permease subunit [Thermoguttaceae bacterium]
MPGPVLSRVWGEAAALWDRSRKIGWGDWLVVIGLGGLLYGVIALGQQWVGEYRPHIEIDLSPVALLRYSIFSLLRGVLAYGISLGFTLVYGYWAAKDRMAERVLIPLLDILQSIPVLGFMPGLILALVALFPRSNVGVELAAVIMIFTGQVWNMTFSFYHSLRSVPADLQEAARVYRFSWWERLKWVELPYSTIGLIWNSMMSMAGGWFFLMINESFRLGERDFRLPGVGSYMSVAIEKGRIDAMLMAMGAMIGIIVLLDQLLWRPLVVWAQKFRLEEDTQQQVVSSWFLDWLRHSQLLALLSRWLKRLRWFHFQKTARRPAPVQGASLLLAAEPSPNRATVASRVSLLLLAVLFVLFAWGAWQLVQLLREVSLRTWAHLVAAAFWTLGRVLLATAIGTLWALPVGIAIGLSPRLSRTLQPVVQIAASFPAPMLFPAAIAILKWANVSLGWGSILLMLLGTQWYILFNVIAGAMAIPADLREAAQSYRITGWQRFRTLYLPAVFPYLITGLVTAAGGAWNASIVAEYVMFKGETLQAYGLGCLISRAAEEANFPVLAASILVMATAVVLFNRMVWRRCYRIAEEKFTLNK